MKKLGKKKLRKNCIKTADIQNIVCNFAADLGETRPSQKIIHIKSNFINSLIF